ncbi:MAG: ferrous iron transport protein B [Clostridiales bacterium]|jgi:ferrous iron transport protein B|nr:ferrous iron transport protein B [Clostridiales bacterium]
MNVALAGNPNSGKTTLFNALTGSRGFVGNWPGVTVEKKSGTLRGAADISVIDLPGLYSLYPYTQEEEIGRAFILSDECDAIINIVDGVNMERNLYLTLQLLETGKPLIIAVNMSDILKKRGIEPDYAALSFELNAPVFAVSAGKGEGLDALIGAVKNGFCKRRGVVGSNREGNISCRRCGGCAAPTGGPPRVYDGETAAIIDAAKKLFVSRGVAHAAFAAAEFFDGAALSGSPCGAAADSKRGGFGGAGATEKPNVRDGYAVKGRLDAELTALNNRVNAVAEAKKQPRDMILADQKYKYISALLYRAKCRKKPVVPGRAVKKIDAIATHKIFGVPIFFAVMLAVFYAAFGAPGQALKGVFEVFYGHIAGGAAQALRYAGASELLRGLIIDGVFGGVGAVIGFLPELAILFLSLSFLEDSGYISRAAFITDGFLTKAGLSGKSFIPLLTGFGCSVPAFMAARTVESHRQKRLTMMIIPFMSCGAKLPVYVLIASAFFPNRVPLVIFCLYVIGIAVGMLSAAILKRSVLKGESGGFIMELPEYRLPSLKNVGRQTFIRIKDFIFRAGTLIVLSCVAVYILKSLGPGLEIAKAAEDSLLARIGRFIAPVFSPMGFGDWRAATAIVSGLTAKEAAAGTLEILFGLSANPDALLGVFSPASAAAFLVFILLYTPCFAAIAALKRETNSAAHVALTIIYQLAVAWLAAFFVYWAWRLIGG